MVAKTNKCVCVCVFLCVCVIMCIQIYSGTLTCSLLHVFMYSC